jgi:hypothetical protein
MTSTTRRGFLGESVAAAVGVAVLPFARLLRITPARPVQSVQPIEALWTHHGTTPLTAAQLEEAIARAKTIPSDGPPFKRYSYIIREDLFLENFHGGL